MSYSVKERGVTRGGASGRDAAFSLIDKFQLFPAVKDRVLDLLRFDHPRALVRAPSLTPPTRSPQHTATPVPEGEASRSARPRGGVCGLRAEAAWRSAHADCTARCQPPHAPLSLHQRCGHARLMRQRLARVGSKGV
eukprot:838168-Rhodomonas_salina.1